MTLKDCCRRVLKPCMRSLQSSQKRAEVRRKEPQSDKVLPDEAPDIETGPTLGMRSQTLPQESPDKSDEFGTTMPPNDLDGQCPPQEHGLRTRQVKSLPRDIERFDPSSRDSNFDDYLRELEHCLLDLPHTLSREKPKLVWKMSMFS